MRKAVYIAIVLWFVRKVLRRCLAGPYRSGIPAYRVKDRRSPGDSGYRDGLDRPWPYRVHIYGTGWLRRVPYGERADFSYRQMDELVTEARQRHANLLGRLAGDCSLSFDWPSEGGGFNTEEYGDAPDGWKDVASVIGGFVHFARGE